MLFLVPFFNVPFHSPLDEIIDKLGGPSAVAEMTGRRARVVRSHPEDKPHYETRESNNQDVDSLNVQEVPLEHYLVKFKSYFFLVRPTPYNGTETAP